ncbi:MAG TPA: hypothetical protein VMV18_07375 [bacterium]|nr:hypothetical protein [bacterium]
MSSPEFQFPSDKREVPRREEHFVLEDLPSTDRMVYGSLAYVFFPASLYYARWDPFVRFHVRQGVGCLVVWIAAGFLAHYAFLDEVPEAGALGYAIATLLTCHGIYHAVSLEFRGVKVLGRLFDRLPLPLKLAEPKAR